MSERDMQHWRQSRADADRLIKRFEQGMRITIAFDKSLVPIEKQNDPKLVEMEQAILDAMADPTYRIRTCLHEAAHGIYMLRAGAQHLVYHCPVAFYDDQKGFDFGSASIQANFGSGVDVTSIDVARWYAAGGVAKRILTDDEDPGDGRDSEEFPNFIRQYAPHLTDEHIDALWKQAVSDVEKDLRSPVFRQEVWREARKFEAWLLTGEVSREVKDATR